MPVPTPLRTLVERTVAEAVDSVVSQAVGKTVPRAGEAGKYRVTHVGEFSRRGVADLIRVASNPEFEGAIVFVDGDVLRALYARGGRLVGADSNVLFERLGRILEKAGKIDRDTRRALVASEEAGGTSSATALVPAEVAKFGLEIRVREVAETLFLVKRGEFVVVAGSPALAPVPEVSLDPEAVAREGIARYEAWRTGAPVATPEAAAPPAAPPPAAAAAPTAPTAPPAPPPAPPPRIESPPPVATTPPPPRPPTLPPLAVEPPTPTVDLEPAEIDLTPEPADLAIPPVPGAPPPPRRSASETADIPLDAMELDLDLPPPEPRGSTTTTADLEPVRDPPSS
jgi:hypothetical protein